MDEQHITPTTMIHSAEMRGGEPLLWVLKTKVDMLTDSLSDIKDTVRRIADMVGVISIIEVNAKQMSKEAVTLGDTVVGLREQVSRIEKAIHDAAGASEVAYSIKIKTLADETTKLRTDWNEKYNIARGIWMAISAIFVLASGAMFMYVKGQTDKIDNTYMWIERQKVEQAMREKGSGSRDGEPEQLSQKAPMYIPKGAPQSGLPRYK